MCFWVFKAPCIKIYKLKPEDSLGSDYWLLENTEKDEYIKNKWLYIKCHGLGYKSKWSDLQFECVPYIVIVWRNKIKYVIGLESPLFEESFIYNPKTGSNIIYYKEDNNLYWETILDYLYISKKDCIKTYNNNIWSRPIYWIENDETRRNVSIPLTSYNMFRNKYQRRINEYVNKNNKKLYYEILYNKVK